MDKLKDNRGISLTELLSSIIIMLLSAAILTVGVRLGAKAYSESVSASEAQVLCATLTNIIADELRYAGTTAVEADGSVKFFSQTFGSENEEGLSFETNEEGQLMLGTNRVLSKRAYPYGLKAETQITYSEDSGIFGVKLRVYSAGGTELAATGFDVRRIGRS